MSDIVERLENRLALQVRDDDRQLLIDAKSEIQRLRQAVRSLKGGMRKMSDKIVKAKA